MLFILYQSSFAAIPNKPLL